MSTEQRRDPRPQLRWSLGDHGFGISPYQDNWMSHGVEQCLGKSVGVAFSFSCDYFCTQPVFCISLPCKLTKSLCPTELSWHKTSAASWSSVQDLPGKERKCSTWLLYWHKQERVKDSPCAVRILLWAFWNENNFWNALFLFFLLIRIVIQGIFCYPQNV